MTCGGVLLPVPHQRGHRSLAAPLLLPRDPRSRQRHREVDVVEGGGAVVLVQPRAGQEPAPPLGAGVKARELEPPEERGSVDDVERERRLLLSAVLFASYELRRMSRES